MGRGHDGQYGEGGSYGRRADEAARAKPGAMGSHDYVREQPTGEVVQCDEETQARIDGLLAQRLALKKARNEPSPLTLNLNLNLTPTLTLTLTLILTLTLTLTLTLILTLTLTLTRWAVRCTRRCAAVP